MSVLAFSDKVVAEFWARVDRSGGPEACWPWRGSINDNGYGLFSPGTKRRVRAHRYAYALLIGPIPEGLCIDHLCRNRACVNPAHCEPVTSKVNLLRGEGFSAVNARKTHCPHGHPYIPENTTTTHRGARFCRTCNRDKLRRLRQSRRVCVA